MSNEIVQRFIDDVEKRIQRENENIEEAKDEMTTGLFHVINSEKWVLENIMEFASDTIKQYLEV